MAYYSDDVISDSSVSLRRFLIPAMLVSLLLHGGLFYGLSKKTLDNFTPSDKPRLVPRVFNVNRLQVDQKLLEPDSKQTETPGSKTADPGSVKNPVSVKNASMRPGGCKGCNLTICCASMASDT